jgi:hypothetical protein
MSGTKFVVLGKNPDGNYVVINVTNGAIDVIVDALPPVLPALNSGVDLDVATLANTPFNQGLYAAFNQPAPAVPAAEAIYPFQVNTGLARGLLVRPYFSEVVPTAGTYTIDIQGLIGSTDGTPVDADWETILSSAPIAAVVGWGPTLRVSPNLAAAANLIAQDIIYPAIRIALNIPMNTADGNSVGRIVVGLAC